VPKTKRNKCVWQIWEVEYLEEFAGLIPLEKIAKKLGRTLGAIRTKCNKEGIPLVRNATMLQLSDVARIVGTDNKTVWYWINLHGLPCKRMALNFKERPFVQFEHLIKWLEHNQDKWYADNMEHLALGQEPKWLKEKRYRDRVRKDKKRQKPWTDRECERVIDLRQIGKTWEQIAEILERPPKAKTIQAALYRYYERRTGKNDSPKIATGQEKSLIPPDSGEIERISTARLQHCRISGIISNITSHS
jgi:hypothetical protein